MSLSALRRLVGFRMGVIGQCFRLTVIKEKACMAIIVSEIEQLLKSVSG